MNAKEFEAKVKSMSAKEIIMAMVNGLKNPVTEIDMGTYGYVRDNICYGCAATNAIAKIAGIQEFIPVAGADTWDRKILDSVSRAFLETFEEAVDSLRTGDILLYNADISDINEQAQIKFPVNNEELFVFFFVEKGCMTTDNYLEKLPMYEWLAQLQLHA